MEWQRHGPHGHSCGQPQALLGHSQRGRHLSTQRLQVSLCNPLRRWIWCVQLCRADRERWVPPHHSCARWLTTGSQLHFYTATPFSRLLLPPPPNSTRQLYSHCFPEHSPIWDTYMWDIYHRHNLQVWLEFVFPIKMVTCPLWFSDVLLKCSRRIVCEGFLAASSI